MSASGGVVSDCKAMLRATDDLRCVLEAHAAHLHEVTKKKLKKYNTKKTKRVADDLLCVLQAIHMYVYIYIIDTHIHKRH
jgi:hypothetical protein